MNTAKRLYLAFICFLLMEAYSHSSQAQLTVQITTTPACNSDGTAKVSAKGGTPPYTFNFFNGAASTDSSITGLSAGFYTVSIADINGLTTYQSFTISSLLNLSIASIPEQCNNDGSAWVTVTGGTRPYSYKWQIGRTVFFADSIIKGQASEFVDITVTDAKGCIRLDSFFLPSNPIIQTSIVTSDTVCDAPTVLSVAASGGKGPYTYYWNTSPVQTTATITKIKPGNYTVVVNDANGCVATNQAYIYSDPNILNLTWTSTETQNCMDKTGSATVVAHSGLAPFTYKWSNGDTMQTITGVEAGKYFVKVTDSNGCSSSDSAEVESSNPVTVSFDVSYITTSVTDGSFTAIATGGTPPYSYKWSTGGTADTINYKNYVGYSVTVTDKTGCTKTKDISIDPVAPENNVWISGIVFYDINGNCIQDLGETGISNTTIYLISGNTYLYGTTNIDGYYTLSVPPGRYTISHTPLYNWISVCPVSGKIIIDATTVDNNYSGNDFADRVLPGQQDLSVSLYCNDVPPGYTGTEYIYFTNNGSDAVNGYISFTHSNKVTFNGASPAAYNYNSATQTAQWAFSNFNPGEESIIAVYLTVPSNTPLNTSISSSVIVSSATYVQANTNNTDSCSFIIIDSFDPNELSVSPQGEGSEGYISAEDSILNYMIKFQNTGTDTAFNIIVTDTLSNYIDPLSINKINASSNVFLSGSNGVLIFTLTNINLLDSSASDTGSVGYISFSAAIKKSMPPGTVISNKAYVYFDYNNPVTTNAVINTLRTSGVTTVYKGVDKQDMLNVFPNPASGIITISYILESNANVSVKVYSMLGEEVTIVDNSSQNAGINKTSFNPESYGLVAGVYIIKLITDEQSQYQKVVITR